MLYHGNAATAIHTMLIQYYVTCMFKFITGRITGITRTFNFSSYINKDLA